MCDPKPTWELERLSIDFSSTGQEEYIFKIRKDHETIPTGTQTKASNLNQIHKRFAMPYI